jgi:predicted amidohydrolase
MEGSSYIAFGHSLVASPWGEVLCDAGICENVLYCDIDFDYADDIRAQLPLLSARRDDVYELKLKK